MYPSLQKIHGTLISLPKDLHFDQHCLIDNRGHPFDKCCLFYKAEGFKKMKVIKLLVLLSTSLDWLLVYIYIYIYIYIYKSTSNDDISPADVISLIIFDTRN